MKHNDNVAWINARIPPKEPGLYRCKNAYGIEFIAPCARNMKGEMVWVLPSYAAKVTYYRLNSEQKADECDAREE